MNLKEIKSMAKDLGIVAGKLKKAELIQAIQTAEKNLPCFGTKDSCEQDTCLWKKDCVKK